MVLIIDGFSEHVAHAKKKWRKNPICGFSRSNQMPQTDQITKIAPNTPISELLYNKSNMFISKKNSQFYLGL